MTLRTLGDIGPSGFAGISRGGELHQLNVQQMPRHNHNVRVARDHNGSGRSQYHLTTTDGEDENYDSDGVSQENRGGNAPHNNMPPFYVLIYIMKIYD